MSYEGIHGWGSRFCDDGNPGIGVSRRDRATRRYRGDYEHTNKDGDMRRSTSDKHRGHEYSYESDDTGRRRRRRSQTKTRQTVSVQKVIDLGQTRFEVNHGVLMLYQNENQWTFIQTMISDPNAVST